MAVALYMVFFGAQESVTTNVAQRIFYFHISLSLMTFLAFFLVAFASFLFLISHRPYWDILASSSAEVGILFCSLVLLTVPLWTKPVWNVWWKWDMRLTISLISWGLYVGYWLVRHHAEGERESKSAALFGSLGFLAVPGAYFLLRWWWTKHTTAISPGISILEFTPDMIATLCLSVATFFGLFFYLLQHRIALDLMHLELDKIRRSLAEHHVKHNGFLVENENFIIEEFNFQEYTRS